MAAFCRDHGIALLAYRTVLGGLLSEKFLDQPEPRQGELNTASLQKYKNMIDAWGGWALLPGIARRSQADCRQASSEHRQRRRALHPRPSSGCGRHRRNPLPESLKHLDDNARAFGFATDGADEAKI